MLLKAMLGAAVLAGTVTVLTPAAGAMPLLPMGDPQISSSVIPVQGWRERCYRLRERIRELEGRMAYAPPWERRRLEWRLNESRREWWRSCR